MKKRVALPIIIMSSVAALIVIAIIVLSVVTVNPLLGIVGGYNDVTVYKTEATTPYPNTEVTVEKLKEGVEDTRFSVMHAILEGRWVYSPKFKTEQDKDGETVRAKLTVTATKNLTADASNYMMLFSFDEKKSVKVEGETVEFDRVKVLVYDTVGEIERIVVYPYIQEKLDITPIDSYYYCYPIEIWSTTSKLMGTLTDYENLLK
ncbi:MAG: hypothetical protein HFK09_00500 [Clostridia bacterium]|nr:hypothetical protein [Clostridia bacterium]